MFVIIILFLVVIIVGAWINGVNKAKAAAYLASKYDEKRKG